MMESQTTKQDRDASHEYITINTVEDPEIGSEEENDEKKKGQTEPRLLKEFTIFTFIELCWDVLVTLTPVAFLGKSVFFYLYWIFLYLSRPLSIYSILFLNVYTTFNLN